MELRYAISRRESGLCMRPFPCATIANLAILDLRGVVGGVL